MKKFVLVVLLVLCLSFGFTACNSNKKVTFVESTEFGDTYSFKNTFGCKPTDKVIVTQYDENHNRLDEPRYHDPFGEPYVNQYGTIFGFKEDCTIYVWCVKHIDNCARIDFEFTRDGKAYYSLIYKC